MRKLLFSAAALAFLAAPVWAQPDNNPHRGGRGHQDQAQTQPGVQPPSQQQAQRGNGGPTNFTNQLQGQQPDQGQNRAQGQNRGGDRGERRGPPQQPQAGNGGPTNFTNQAPQGQQPQDRGDRGYGRDYRGYDNGGYRGNGRDYRGNRDYGNGRDYRGDNRYGNRSGYGQRHDFSSFRDFHRSFRAERRFRGPDYRRPAGWYNHRWTFGEFLPAAFWARDYWLSDYAAYDLPPPPYGAVWVRVGRDALLIDRDSGEIITVEYDVFY